MNLVIFLTTSIELEIPCRYFEVYDGILHIFDHNNDLAFVIKEWRYFKVNDIMIQKSADEIMDDMERE